MDASWRDVITNRSRKRVEIVGFTKVSNKSEAVAVYLSINRYDFQTQLSVQSSSINLQPICIRSPTAPMLHLNCTEVAPAVCVE